MDRLHASESQQKWDLSGRRITQLIFDPASVRLVAWSLSGTAEIRLEVPFRLMPPEGSECVLDPEQTLTLSPVLTLLNEPLRAVTADRTGALCIELEDGSTIAVEPHAVFEAWAVSGSGDLEEMAYLCGPGGGSPWGRYS